MFPCVSSKYLQSSFCALPALLNCRHQFNDSSCSDPNPTQTCKWKHRPIWTRSPPRENAPHPRRKDYALLLCSWTGDSQSKKKAIKQFLRSYLCRFHTVLIPNSARNLSVSSSTCQGKNKRRNAPLTDCLHSLWLCWQIRDERSSGSPPRILLN